jgi:hypothetical protein
MNSKTGPERKAAPRFGRLMDPTATGKAGGIPEKSHA